MQTLEHLSAILGLGILCGVWVLIQRWLEKLDSKSDNDAPRSQCGGCSGCSPDKTR